MCLHNPSPPLIKTFLNFIILLFCIFLIQWHIQTMCLGPLVAPMSPIDRQGGFFNGLNLSERFRCSNITNDESLRILAQALRNKGKKSNRISKCFRHVFSEFILTPVPLLIQRTDLRAVCKIGIICRKSVSLHKNEGQIIACPS